MSVQRPRDDPSRSGFIGRLRSFLRDESGVAAVYVGLSFTFLFGATALVFDLARLMTEQSELQSAADAAALAGAAELDGQANARQRAAAAANGAFGANFQTYATGSRGVTIQTPVFLSSIASTDPALLPANPSPSGDVVATSDAKASFIRVTVQSRSIVNAFITLVGGPSVSTASAVATAGFTQITCSTLPLFICNPQEPTDPHFTPAPGQMIWAVKHQSGTWAPGEFALTNPPGQSQGAQIVANLLATAGAGQCTTSSIDPKPGLTASAVSDGLDVRFDMYPNSAGMLGANANGNASYPPALDVVKGMIPTAHGNSGNVDPCSPQTAAPPAAKALPRDSCLISSTCTPAARIGDGNWDRQGYWTVNHGGTIPSSLLSASRYQVYQYEIANGIPLPNVPTGHVEDGRPQCYTGSGAKTADRRLINVPIVNCTQQGVTGNSNTNIRPAAVVQGFMTEPADSSDVFIEVVQVLQANGSNGVIHNVVQLYR